MCDELTSPMTTKLGLSIRRHSAAAEEPHPRRAQKSRERARVASTWTFSEDVEDVWVEGSVGHDPGPVKFRANNKFVGQSC